MKATSSSTFFLKKDWHKSLRRSANVIIMNMSQNIESSLRGQFVAWLVFNDTLFKFRTDDLYHGMAG